MDEERHCILLLGTCENRARCGWNCMLRTHEPPQGDPSLRDEENREEPR